jgi:hypothetical protein
LAEVVVCVGDKRNACRVLEGRVEGERPLQTCRQIWYVNIKMYLKEIGWNAGDWAYWAEEVKQCQTFVKT